MKAPPQLDAADQYYRQKIRELFERIDNCRYAAKFDAWQTPCWGISDADLQSLKSEYLEDK